MIAKRKPDLTIVILSFNVRKLLDNCLKSLFADKNSQNWQVIVVDNNSDDDSVEYIKKYYGKKIEIIVSEKNLGFAAGNNLAVPKIKADFVLFLNPDTEVPIDTIPYVRDYLSNHQDVGAATCKVQLPNGNLDDSCHRGFPTPWNSLCYFSGLTKLFPNSKLFSGYTYGFADLDKVHEIDSLTGAFMMLRVKVGHEVGWWDEDYFWNGDDLDFCYRIKELGLKIIYLPDRKIIHYKGSSAGYKSSSHNAHNVKNEIKMMAAKSSTKAMKIFYSKHYKYKYPEIVSQMVFTGIKLLDHYRKSKLKL